MPEVIEVKTYVDFITKHTKNQTLENINILQGRYRKHGPFKGFKNLIRSMPLRIDNIESKGKYMYITLSNNLIIGITLGLTGGWFWQPHNSNTYHHGLDNTSTRSKYDPEMVKYYLGAALKHLNVSFEFKHGTLYFYDQLSFGTISILTDTENQRRLKSIGLDMIDINTTFDLFKNAITKSKNLDKPIGNVIMDQKTISGIGNYLRADALWMSHLSPFRKVKDLSLSELNILYKNSRKLIWGIYNYKKAISNNILSSNDKLPIDYDRDFFVYMHDKDLYGNKITKERLYEGSQIRYIYWVKKIQK